MDKDAIQKQQNIIEEALNQTLKGMNIGYSENPLENGEFLVIKYIKENLSNKNNIIIFDVGANVGDYSALLSSVFSENVSIHSFEPAKTSYSKLNSRKIPNTFTHNFGISDFIGEQVLYKNENLSVLNSLYNRRLDHFNISLDSTETVRIISIDTFCKDNNINDIDFLKLDIEGNELKALKGAKEFIEKNKIKYIQFEFGGCNLDSKTYFQDYWYLLHEKYRIYRIVKDGLFELKNYKEMYELFMLTNFLAELKE